MPAGNNQLDSPNCASSNSVGDQERRTSSGSASDYKLYYFNFRGRAEIVRYVFAAAEQPYEDVRFDKSELDGYKHLAPFGQVPFLQETIDGQTYYYAQSITIGRFLANRFGLAGSNERERVMVDMYIEQINDFFCEAIKVFLEKTESSRKKHMETMFSGEILPRNLIYCEEQLERNGTGYLVGGELTWADLYLVSVLEFFGDKKSEYLEGFPLVTAHDQRVRSLPTVARWISNRPPSEL